jgi:hypothetical protein
MNSGDRVKVQKIWAGAAPGYGNPLKAWFSGYTFEGYEPGGKAVLVRTSTGIFAGAVIRVLASDVKPEVAS